MKMSIVMDIATKSKNRIDNNQAVRGIGYKSLSKNFLLNVTSVA